GRVASDAAKILFEKDFSVGRDDGSGLSRRARFRRPCSSILAKRLAFEPPARPFTTAVARHAITSKCPRFFASPPRRRDSVRRTHPRSFSLTSHALRGVGARRPVPAPATERAVPERALHLPLVYDVPCACRRLTLADARRSAPVAP